MRSKAIVFFVSWVCEQPLFGEVTNAPLDARLRGAAVRFMWNLCQVVRLFPAAGFQAATLLDIACLRHDGGILAEHLPLVCTVIVKLLKKADSATTFMSNASMVPHAQRLVGCLRRAGVVLRWGGCGGQLKHF